MFGGSEEYHREPQLGFK